jgi:endonuclease/exonuclease/phosphatase family metal-dependent hydrolase
MQKSWLRIFSKQALATTNITVGILFLVAGYAGSFKQLYFWGSGLLTLGSFYLLLILICFFIFWLFAKPKLALITVLVLLLGAKPLMHIFPIHFSGFTINKKNATALRVMTWNVQHFDILNHKNPAAYNKQNMLNLINEVGPDVACFQEMVGALRNPKAINYVPSIKQQLNLNYEYYSYLSANSFDGDHEFGTIIFSKYPIINRQQSKAANNSYNNVFQYVDIVKDNDTFRIFNVHLQSLKFSSNSIGWMENPTSDVNQSKFVIKRLISGFNKRKQQTNAIVAALQQSPYPIILCGDFNDVPNSYAYSQINQYLNNAYRNAGFGLGGTYTKISGSLRIDNIFYSKQLQTLQTTVIKKPYSDHYPLVADLELKK